MTLVSQSRFKALGVMSAAALLALSPALNAHPGHPVVDDGVMDSAVEATHQHGDTAGHLPAGSQDVELVSKLRLTDIDGAIADVGVHEGFAYLAQWREACPDGGVHVVDITDPSAPRAVTFIPANKNSSPAKVSTLCRSTSSTSPSPGHR